MLTKRVARELCGVALAIVLLPFAAKLRAQSPVVQWRVTELWRVDGTSSGEPFASVRDFVVARDGTVWVLDFKDQSIRRFDASGKELARVGRKGSGPGEMRNANGLLVTNDGSVWVNDPGNSRLTVFGADGKFLRQHVLSINGYGWQWNAWVDRRTGDVIDPFINMHPGNGTSYDWRRITSTGVVRDTFPMPTCANGRSTAGKYYRAETKGKGSTNRSYPFAYGGGSAPTRDTAVWCASPTDTRIALIRIGRNDTLLRTTVDVARISVPKSDRDSAIAAAREAVSKYESNDFDVNLVPTIRSGIASLAVDDDGHVWVQHAPRGGESSVTFDVHDRTGKHLGRLNIPHKPSTEGLVIRARGNDLWIGVRDDDDVLGIAHYRIVR